VMVRIYRVHSVDKSIVSEPLRFHRDKAPARGAPCNADHS
jgi:hypothetical protein